VEDLKEITGLDDVSLQPNSGAQGEYAGLRVIRAFQASQGQQHRNVCLIPSSAHGTNPASAHMAGMEVVPVKCDVKGNLDMADVAAKLKEYKDTVSTMYITIH
jgi:glycine dehydrogenase